MVTLLGDSPQEMGFLKPWNKFWVKANFVDIFKDGAQRE